MRNQKRNFTVFITFLGSSIVILQYWFLQSTLPVTDTSRHSTDAKLDFNNERRKYISNSNDLKLVLFYTPLFGKSPWPGLEKDYNFTHWNHIPCDVQSCRVTYNKSDLSRSDAVIFHGRDLPSVMHMKHIVKQKPPQQKWVYFIHESPKFTFYDPSHYNGYFNWTMSYRRDSDFFVPYRTYTRLEPDEIARIQAENRNYAQGKDRLLVWIVSHCKGLREDYVRKLMKFIKVDVFGSCSRRFNQTETCPRSSSICDNKLKRYKFIFALENSYCVDYITEKYWYAPLDHDNVPIVLGGANYDDKITIPGSFINILDFPSAESLANYLHYLDKNDTAYNEYFRWRRLFKPVLPESWTCQMCAALNNDLLPPKVYNNIDEYWGEKSNCGQNERRIREFLGRLIEEASTVSL